MLPWHLGKRSNGLKGPKLSPHPLGKRSPSADPGGVSLSVTANMDTLRNRLLWSLHNNHKQVSHELGTAQDHLFCFSLGVLIFILQDKAYFALDMVL